MSNPIEGLKPELVWKYFADICKIPRGSKNEKGISDYVFKTAGKLGLEAEQDEFLNVVARKPASKGRENVPGICLQGHLDMVCEKNKDTVHDFEKDPIRLVRDGNFLRADGTTLGADNGIAVAANLAVMEDRSLKHGPVELLFTADEETGLTGANNLRPGFVRSTTLINLDSEEEGALYVGCSGGRTTIGTWNLVTEAAPAKHVPVFVKVKGLKGGHSGLEIHKGRGNSIKILVRVLAALEKSGARLSTIEGGNKGNAIPREAEAFLFVPVKKAGEAKEIVSSFGSMIRDELGPVDPDVSIALEEVKGKKTWKVLKRRLQGQILRTISGLPHGVMKMSAEIPGLVETSTNVAIIRTDKKSVSLVTSQRSSVASEIEDIVQTVEAILTLGGAKVKLDEGYPGWKPNMDSPILKAARTAYKSLYGKEPAVKAIHAGLECGIIGEKFSGMDMVSFGPTLEGVHSPDEKMHIDTVEKFWSFLIEILKNVA